MNIDLMLIKRDMNYVVENIESSSGDFGQKSTGGLILSSISFSSMLENAIRQELLKKQVRN